MKRESVETIVGIIVLIGCICLAYLAVKLVEVEIFGGDYYELTANFGSVSGLRTGAPVEIGGVDVGTVYRIRLDVKRDDTAKVYLQIKSGITIPDDTIATVRATGIVGDKYVSLQPGKDKKLLADGERIRHTESAMDLEDIISEYIQGRL